MFWFTRNCLGVSIGVVLLLAVVVSALFLVGFFSTLLSTFTSSYYGTIANPQGVPIASSYTDPPYVTPDGTVICSGNVSVRTPYGLLYGPDSDPTTGEVVAISGSGYTIIFTYSASCMQYPRLASDQVDRMLNALIKQQQTPGSGACGYVCTGIPQKWVFSS